MRMFIGLDELQPLVEQASGLVEYVSKVLYTSMLIGAAAAGE